MSWSEDDEVCNLVEIEGAIKRATGDFKLCPNRVWAVARSLPSGERVLPDLIPADIKGNIVGHHGHDQCTLDFCEHSRRDFTAVVQRHELPLHTNTPCRRLRKDLDLFQRDILERAANAETSTAWKLDGLSMVEPHEGIMAVSHVWSDGTGAGLESSVNECLYHFFKGIAEQFLCKGIWWDTICMPAEKGARNKAINKIQRNYEDARITLVHDSFLRDWDWVDAETACFAIIMSPWFSRGWTSLELAKSRKVKVIFKGSKSPLIKDLDEDILAEVSDTSHRAPFVKIASDVIKKLRRKELTNLDELLNILGPRHTSWPRDTAIISGLLVGVEIPKDALQQEIYQKILLKICEVSQGHLFHSSATMSKCFSWCPTNLLDMPVAARPGPCLRVAADGDAIGLWKVISPDSIPPERYIWVGKNPLIEAMLRLAIYTEKNKHVLLAEPGEKRIRRALLVKAMTEDEDKLTSVSCMYIGPVYFRPEVDDGKESEAWIETEIRIGDIRGMVEIKNMKAWDYIQEVEGKRQIGPRETYYNVQERRTSNEAQLSAAGEGEKRVHPPQKGRGDDNHQRLLRSAAANGEAEEVQRLLKNGAKSDLKDKYTWTPLHYASWRGHEGVVKALVRNGADQRLQDECGQQPIHLAAERGYEKIVSLLLGGSDLNGTCKDDGHTALQRATWGGFEAVVKLLLEKSNPGPDKDKETALRIAAENGYASLVGLLVEEAGVNIQDSARQTALFRAAQNGHAEVVKLLIQENPVSKSNDNVSIVDSKDANGLTALWWAAWNGRRAVVEQLMEHGYPDIRVADKDKKTAFHIAAENGNVSVVRLLLREVLLEGSANIQDSIGRTALHLAARNGHTEVVEMLLQNVDANIKDSTDETALHLAAQNGHTEVVKALIHKSDLNILNKGENTAFQIAVEEGHASIVKTLLRAADRSIQDPMKHMALDLAVRKADQPVIEVIFEDGINLSPKYIDESRTPLSWAAEQGFRTFVERRLENGADVDSRDRSGRTPLWFAAESGYLNVVKLLIEWNAKVDAMDKEGTTPLSRAIQNSDTEVVKLLLEEDANVDCKDAKGRTPLWWAAFHGRDGNWDVLLRLLISRAVDLDARDEDMGRTALSFAAAYGRTDVARLLIEKGADVNAKDAEGWTPLKWAEMERRETVVQLLELVMPASS